MNQVTMILSGKIRQSLENLFEFILGLLHELQLLHQIILPFRLTPEHVPKWYPISVNAKKAI